MDEDELIETEELDEISPEGLYDENEFDDSSFNNGYERTHDREYYKNRQKELAEERKELEQEKNRNFKMKDGSEGEPVKSDGSNTLQKNKFDHFKDNAKLAGNKINSLENKVNSVRDKLNNPLESAKENLQDKVTDKLNPIKNKVSSLKDKGKEATKEVGKKVGKAIGKGILALMKTPYFWMAVGVLLIILLLIMMVGAIDEEDGYYNPACDFTSTQINYFCSVTELDETINIKEYTKSVLNGYVKDKEYSDDTLKSAMLAIKTNALTYGKIKDIIVIEDCNIPYGYGIDAEKNEKYEALYEEVEEQIFVSTEYESVEGLEEIDRLDIDSDIIDEYEELAVDNSYRNILTNIYGDDKDIYELEDHCEFLELTSSSGYWWPIGSSEETSDGIYGGTPIANTITSKFGKRILEGKVSDHRGVDIGIDDGCYTNDYPIIASFDGVVDSIYNECPTTRLDSCGGGFGNNVQITNSDGVYNIYAHLKENSIKVSVGDKVRQGELIGYMGSSGHSTGCHLHFELRVNGTPVDPLYYISEDNPRPKGISELNITSNPSNSIEGKRVVCKELINSGYSKATVGAILGNIAGEGGFKSNNMEDAYEEGNHHYNVGEALYGIANDEAYTKAVDNGTYTNFVNDSIGYGIIQWTDPSRKRGLLNKAKNQGKSISDLGMQIEYLFDELKEIGKDTYRYITDNNSLYDSIYYFCAYFERPYDTINTCQKRAMDNTETISNYIDNGCN